ncbi:hypothetical protein Hsero_3400 [Herbaspirillum seropedicae SmR1]|uniref:Uncharacterized protein n=1 Tax=Herbaspirillum seropedicae (strain SmR1) TaxID=757424 RepID=D8IPI4_HERSS|nr:hypothetical protein Hsero_3400 [Herbaspirillum seropedicae SmR1]
MQAIVQHLRFPIWLAEVFPAFFGTFIFPQKDTHAFPHHRLGQPDPAAPASPHPATPLRQ